MKNRQSETSFEQEIKVTSTYDWSNCDYKNVVNNIVFRIVGMVIC